MIPELRRSGLEQFLPGMGAYASFTMAISLQESVTAGQVMLYISPLP